MCPRKLWPRTKSVIYYPFCVLVGGLTGVLHFSFPLLSVIVISLRKSGLSSTTVKVSVEGAVLSWYQSLAFCPIAVI